MRRRCDGLKRVAFVPWVVAAVVGGWQGGPEALAQTPQRAPIRGLTSIGRLNFLDDRTKFPRNDLNEPYAHPGIYAAAVVLATWDQLEPSSGVYDFSVIDSALATIATYNQTYPLTPLQPKLRIFVAAHAPTYLLNADGGPVVVLTGGQPVSFAHWWTNAYHRAWVSLQEALAAQYNTRIAEVAISSCSSKTAEPTVLPLDDPSQGAVLIAAGFTDAFQQNCIAHAWNDYAAWTGMPLDYAFGPLKSAANTMQKSNTMLPMQVMQNFRTALGGLGTVSNHGLQHALKPAGLPIYDEIAALGAPVAFQDQSRSTDPVTAFPVGVSYDMTEYEMFDSVAAGGTTVVTGDQLKVMSAVLAASAPP